MATTLPPHVVAVFRNACVGTRPLIISEPCVGAGGLNEIKKQTGWKYKAVNVYDVDARLHQYYGEQYGRFGPYAGDLLMHVGCALVGCGLGYAALLQLRCDCVVLLDTK